MKAEMLVYGIRIVAEDLSPPNWATVLVREPASGNWYWCEGEPLVFAGYLDFGNMEYQRA